MDIASLELLILNECQDDTENLEQLFKAICLEFSGERYDPMNPKSFYFRDGPHGIHLNDIATVIPSLITKGWLAGKMEDGSPVSMTANLSFVWSAWFRTSDAGRQVLSASR